MKLIFETDDAFRKAAPFLTKNPINRPAMSSKIFFVAAVLHFVHPVEKKQLKTLQDDTKLCQLQLSVTKFSNAT